MARGGARAGRTAAKYANRTDLPGSSVGPNGQVMKSGGPLPIAVPTGQPYGAAGAQRAAQAALPMSAPPVAGASPTPPVGASQAGGPMAPPTMTGLPPGVPAPGSMQPLDAPTDRPDEHLMTGVPSGGGAGLSALTPMVSHPIIQAAAALNSIPNPPPQVKAILGAVNATLANQGAA